MILNFSPKNTCKNYNVNNFSIPDEKIAKDLSPFKNILINGGKYCEKIESDNNALINQANNCKLHFDIDKNEHIETKFMFDSNSYTLAEHIEVKTKEKIEGSVNIKYLSHTASYHNGQIDFIIGNNAKLRATIFSSFDKDSLSLLNINVKFGKDSNLELNIVDISSSHSTQRLLSTMDNENCSLDIKTIYICDNNHADYNYVVDVLKNNNTVDMQCVGVTSGSAVKSFKGTIDFKQGAKKCIGKERELCLPLSCDSVLLSSPMILCSEEDVDISHANSVGKIDDKTLFYMNSRGIDRREATKIFVLSKMSKIMQNLDEEIKNTIINTIDRIDYEK